MKKIEDDALERFHKVHLRFASQEDVMEDNRKKNELDHEMLKQIIDMKTDNKYYEKFKHEQLEVKINNEAEHEFKSSQIRILEERFVEQDSKVDQLVSESKTLSESSNIVKEAHRLVQEIKTKMEKMTRHHKVLEKKMELKIDSDEYYKMLNVKVDRQEVNNMIQGTTEKDRISIAVKEEVTHILKIVNDMGKFWDAKLVKLRNETDIFSLSRQV